MACFPRSDSTKLRILAEVSAEFSRLGTSSTNASTGAGLKNWTPTTCSGQAVATPSFITGVGGGVRRQDRLRGANDLAQRSDEIFLGWFFLNDGLDHQLAISQVLQFRRISSHRTRANRQRGRLLFVGPAIVGTDDCAEASQVQPAAGVKFMRHSRPAQRRPGWCGA
jgi:hypothetical protein